MPRAQKQDQWSYICGEKGANRVRVFVHHSGNLFVEYKRDGRKLRQSLGHKDTELAKVEADRLAANLRSPDSRSHVTLNQLFDNYERDVTPSKSLTTQKHDRTTLIRFLEVFGKDRSAETLTFRDAAHYERLRRSAGDLRPRRRKTGASASIRYPIKARSLIYDFRLLKAVLNWSVGSGLLERNPMAGYKVKVREGPRRPVFNDAQYRALLSVAKHFPWQFECLLILANETGHRLSSILKLEWRDISFAASRITWRSENDKIRNEHATPMTEGARQAFERARSCAAGIGNSAVLPGPRDRSRPVGTDLARDWLQRAQVRAGLDLT